MAFVGRHTDALNIFDRFRVVAKIKLALDDLLAAEARRMAHEGCEPLLNYEGDRPRHKETTPRQARDIGINPGRSLPR